MTTIKYNHGGDKEKRKLARKLAKEAAARQREEFSEKLAERKPVSAQTMNFLAMATAIGAFDVRR